jgi:hypothetical protein
MAVWADLHCHLLPAVRFYPNTQMARGEYVRVRSAATSMLPKAISASGLVVRPNSLYIRQYIIN